MVRSGDRRCTAREAPREGAAGSRARCGSSTRRLDAAAPKRPAQPKTRRMAVATRVTSSPVSSGKMGSASVSRAAASATGKDALRAGQGCAKQGWRWSGAGNRPRCRCPARERAPQRIAQGGIVQANDILVERVPGSASVRQREGQSPPRRAAPHTARRARGAARGARRRAGACAGGAPPGARRAGSCRRRVC